jgi:arylsulfatase A-like enzyme
MFKLDGFESQFANAAAIDLAPTVLRLLDVPIPSHMVGQPLVR